MTSPVKVIHAVLIDGAKKRIIKDNVVFNNPGGTDLDVSGLRDKAGNFLSLFIRITDNRPQMGGFGGNSEEKRKKTNGIINITLDKSLAPKEAAVKSRAADGDFIEVCGGRNGYFFISSFTDNKIISERFDSSGNAAGVLSADLSIKRKSRLQAIFNSDSSAESSAHLSVAYIDDDKHDYVQLFRFDFGAMKANSSEKVILNKEYVRSLKDGKENDGLKHFGEIYNLRPVQLEVTADKIILVKEIQGQVVDKNTVTYIRTGSIISVYSKDLTLLYETAIDKKCAFNLFSFAAIVVQPKDDKLYIITDELKGLLNFKAYLSVMDLGTGKILRSSEIEKEESGSNWLAMPFTVMWFANNFVVPFTSAKAFFTLDLETSMVIQKY